MDWSDPQFDDRQAILDRWRKEEPQADGYNSNVVQVFAFRNTMREGDIIIVSDGNLRFRAIGVVAGLYTYAPTGVGTYNHRRAVDWRVVLDESLPVEAISDKRFSQMAFYQINDAHLKREALARLLQQDAQVTSHAPDQFVLIIDEINRANISKVFGEVITLIEPDKRLGRPEALTLVLPYSGDTFGVPENLHIVGTMNTADRSIALLDTALRRRFTFRELMPDPMALHAASERTGMDLVTLLRVLNGRIEYLFDRDHQIGHAYFMGCDSKEAVDEVMRHKIIPLLAEYFYDDWGKVALILGDASGAGRFLTREVLPAPPGLGDEGAEPRVRWSVKEAFAPDAYDAFA